MRSNDNAAATISFLQKIEDAYPKKMCPLILRSGSLLPKQRGDFGIYSPNLNPIERLWKWMKERALYNTYDQDVEDFRSAGLGFFDALG